MFKTIFIIFISVTASAITTAGLLYRYTVPVEQAQQAPVAAAPAQTPAPIDYTNAQPGPVEILDEYVNIQAHRPPVSTAPSVQLAPSPPPAGAAAPKRAFDHKLLMSDISALSNKLERFNDFLSNEVKRLKGDPDKDKP